MKKALLVSGVLCASIAQSAFAESSNKRIMVISDPHLIADGVITESHGTGNCGVISETIFDRAVEMVKNAKPDLLLIPGDLTYTGEASAHSLMAEKLSSLKKAGIQTLVIPGNHDIRNIYSLDDGNANISSDEFKKLYADYGYNTTDGTLFDAASLSWAKSVSDDLAVIGLDGCIYSDEDANYFSEGALRKSTLDWMTTCAKKFKADGKMVIAMVHHNIMEHYDGQSVTSPKTVLNTTYMKNPNELGGVDVDSVMIWNAFKDAGIHYVFTGHTHSGDASVRKLGENGYELYDITTGSLITYPNTIRTITVNPSEDKLEWATSYLQTELTIDGVGTSLTSYSKTELDLYASSVAAGELGSLYDMLSSMLSQITTMNYEGDEDKNGGPELYAGLESVVEMANNAFSQTQYLKAKALLPSIKSMLFNSVMDSLSVVDNPSTILYDGCLLASDSASYLGLEYIRTFEDTLWQALYLPFDVKYEEIPARLKVAILTEINGSQLDFTSLADSSVLPANSFAMVKATEIGTYVIKKSDNYSVSAYESSLGNDSIQIIGTYKEVTADGSCWTVKEGELVKPETTVRPMRWIVKSDLVPTFKVDGGVVSGDITLPGDTIVTKAAMIFAPEYPESESQMFSISGQCINGTPARGTIYIQNKQKKIAK